MNRKNGHNKIKRQLKIGFDAVADRFKEVSRKTIRTNAVVYEEDEDFLEEIAALVILAMMLEDGHYLDENILLAVRTGSNSMINAMEIQVKKLSPRSNVNLRALLETAEFQTQLIAHQQIMRDKIADMSGRLSSQVTDVIKKGMESQLPQAEILKQVRGRFSAMSGLSLQSVHTTINESLNNAKLEAIRAANLHLIQFGMGALVVHISAKLKTTRPHHEARHNKTYTFIQQMRWWNTGTNRLNCYCSVKPKVVKKG